MKDHSTFLRAAAQVSQQSPACRFVCIGRGPQAYQDEMKALAASLLGNGKVFWIGNCADQDLPAAYNAFDVLVSSSYGEGLPVVLGEAMASGTPCVVTNVGDSAFAVGETGLVVPPQNPALLAEAIGKLLEMGTSERLALGHKARQRVLDYFSIEKMASAYELVFEEIAKQ
jgi:glycosyltransferase involved in cell wall biosynthesis